MLNQIRKNYFLLSFCAFACFPMLPNAAQSIVFGFFLFCSLLYKFGHNKWDKSFFVFIVSILFLLILTSYRSEDKIELKTKLLQIIPFIVGLLITFLSPKSISKKQLDIVKRFYLFSLVVYIFLYLNYFLEAYEIWESMQSFPTNFVNLNYFEKIGYFLFVRYYYYYSILIQIQDLKNNTFFSHYFYLNIVFLLGIIFSLENIDSNNNSKRKNIFYMLLTILFTGFIVFMPSTTKYFVLLFLLFVLGKKVNSKPMLFVFFIISLIGTKIYFSKLLAVLTQIIHSEGVRISMYKCVFNKINGINSIFGIGIGDIKLFINSYLQTILNGRNENSAYTLFNTHNQYLEFYLSFGIIGLIFIFSYLICSIRKYLIKTKDITNFLLIILILSLLNFENMLDRSWGTYTLIFYINIIRNYYLVPSISKIYS